MDGRLEVRLNEAEGSEEAVLRGELDYETIEAETEVLARFMSLQNGIVLDLAGVTFMDSSGVRFLLNMLKHHEGPVTLKSTQPAVRRVLDVAGLTPLFDMQD